jgi:FdhD protein
MARLAHQSAERTAWRSGAASGGARAVPNETPVAMSYRGETYAVMMATPCDLEDFALGFTLNEGIATSFSEIENVDIVEVDGGFDLQIGLSDIAYGRIKQRKRAMAGPVGCGLCGVDSIAAAMRPTGRLVDPGFSLSPAEVCEALDMLSSAQPLNALTRAMHGAGLYVPGQGLKLVREDVGRHNALDKLCGAVARGGVNGGTGAVVLTSRVSLEMVQKTAVCGSSYILAVSAPTALAIDTARKAGITLAALVRGPDFEVFTHPNRIQSGAKANVA